MTPPKKTPTPPLSPHAKPYIPFTIVRRKRKLRRKKHKLHHLTSPSSPPKKNHTQENRYQPLVDDRNDQEEHAEKNNFNLVLNTPDTSDTTVATTPSISHSLLSQSRRVRRRCSCPFRARQASRLPSTRRRTLAPFVSAVSHETRSPPWPRDFKTLVVQTFNFEGLSDPLKEELLHRMTTSGVDVVILQETWGNLPQETRETPDESLFLLHGTPRAAKQGRNSCGVGFLLSPSSKHVW